MDKEKKLELLKANFDSVVKAHEEQLATLVREYEESIRQMKDAMDSPEVVPTAVRMTAPTGEDIVVLNIEAFDQITMTLDLMADVVNEMQKTL